MENLSVCNSHGSFHCMNKAKTFAQIIKDALGIKIDSSMSHNTVVSTVMIFYHLVCML